MGRGAIGREHVQALGEGAGDVAVEVHAGRNQAVRSHHCPGRLHPIQLGVLDLLDRHGAVQVQVETIHRETARSRSRNSPFSWA